MNQTFAWSRTGRRTTIPMAGEPEDFILDLRFRKCVFFLLRKKKRGGGKEPFYFCGTAFAVSVGLQGHEIGKPDWLGGVDYVVTAAHVVKNTRPDEDLFIRVNRVSKSSLDIKVPVSTWKCHSSTDVAVCAVEWPADELLDVMTIPVTQLPKGPEGVYANEVVEGEEVTICGLLTSFPGSDRIQPIVRTGKIALMPYEKMRIQLDRETTGDADVYLLEMISWPGLSGSPIIVYPNRNPRNARRLDFLSPYLILGLVHGNLEYDKEVKFNRDRATVRLGSGIVVAIPGESIREVLMNHPDLVTQRLEMLEQVETEKKPIATPHSSDEPAPFTQENFELDLRKVSRKVTPSRSDSKKK
jgi:hypothetical protein